MKTLNMCFIFLLLAGLTIPNLVYAEDPPTMVWDRTICLGSDEWGEDIAVDNAGNVYVTGSSYDGAGYNWLTVKYGADGTLLWWKPYDTGDGDDIACAVDVDNSGNVYVVGYTPDNTIHDWRYIKYDKDGTLLWNKIRDWGPDVNQNCHDIALDTTNGYMYMVGDFIGTDGSWNYLTVKCDLDGNYIGENSWSGGSYVDNNGWAITIDQAGYIYVTGIVWNATRDWGTVKYDANLTLMWHKTYDSGADENVPQDAIAVDNNTGDVYVVGWVENADTDWQIIKYDLIGTFLWYYTIATDYDEGAWGVEVDSAGYIYINGDYDTGGTDNWNCLTMKYDSDCNLQWAVDYHFEANDAGRSIEIDNAGYVYVVGHSFRTVDCDFVTIKYEQQTGIVEQIPANCSCLLSLEVINNPTPAPVLRYAFPQGAVGSLSFYSADGRKIEEYALNSSSSTFTWDVRKIPCGIYFARLVSDDHSVSTKICLTR